MDALINPETRDYSGERTSTLANAVYLRLMTPLGSWWADISLGSRLHELTREKDLSRFYILARQYAEQALNPLIEDGRVREISVSAMSPQKGHCELHVRVLDASGQEHHYAYPVKVA